MDLALTIIWFIFILVGIIWAFLPIIPWPILSYIAIILLQIADKPFSNNFMIIAAIVCLIITIFDYIIPILWTKKMWWTKRWTRWNTVGLIVWIIILPILGITIWPFGLIWLIGWPFLWAYIWEIAYQNDKKSKQDNKKALKSAIWSFLWFVSWTLLKLAYTVVIAIYFIPKAFNVIKNMF